jgi:hypothetical protein
VRSATRLGGRTYAATDDERAALTTEIRREWNAALDNATLDRCRYRTGGEQNSRN